MAAIFTKVLKPDFNIMKKSKMYKMLLACKYDFFNKNGVKIQKSTNSIFVAGEMFFLKLESEALKNIKTK